jgi:iron complex transport system substrate-binding protein
MYNKYYLLAILLVFIIILSLQALVIGNSSKIITYSKAHGISSKPIYVRDALGRTIMLNKTPERVVSLAPSITESLFYLGLSDKIVGVDNISYTDPYYGISDYVKKHGIVPVGGYWWSAVSVEKILSLKPDVILADAGAHQPLLHVFQQYNLTIVYLHGGSSRSIEDIYDDFKIIATIFNVSNSKITSFISKLEDEINKYDTLITKNISHLRVVVVVGIYNGIWVAGKSTFMDDILSRLGLVNAAKTIGWSAVSIEDISMWKPDIILVTAMGISNDTLKKAGLYNLGIPIVFMSKNLTDALSRPGPLILRAPSLLYSFLLSVKSKIIHTTTTIVTNNTVNYNSEIAVAIYVTLAFIIGLVAGYAIFRRT